MGSVVLGVFDSRDQAERAAQELRNKGFHKDISLVAKDEGGQIEETRMGGGEEGDTAIEGVTTGGALGGLAGLAAGAGALAIPGDRASGGYGTDSRTLIRSGHRRIGRWPY
ncbi:MAG: hypothetical protein RJR35_11220 [Thermoanaerobacterales bacterium]|nr:hypothetical protein [Thermoanaerobacterales bacterium]